MKNAVLLLLIFLSGCVTHTFDSRPIFSDDEKLERAVLYDEWFRASSVK